MVAPPLPLDETGRLRAVHSYAVLDTPSEAEYNAITRLASQICGTPVSLITLLDEDRQWFKSAHGTKIRETPREWAFCNHAIMQPHHPLVVPDLRQDERFQTNPLVTEDPHAVFYAGVPLTDSEGFALGSLCVIDTHEKNLTAFQLDALQTLAGQVVVLLQLHRKSKTAQTVQRLLEERNEELQKAVGLLLAAAPATNELEQHLTALQRAAALTTEEKAILQRSGESLLRMNTLLGQAKELV